MKIKAVNIRAVYGCLFDSLTAIYFIPLDIFNMFSSAVKLMFACLLLNILIFFAGIIFGHSLRAIEHKNTAYGLNIIGAVVGGLLEFLSIIFGIQALMCIVRILDDF